jgi:flavin reductase (DIM6/NTAB) family NADH-FMN oxidoreductase RutF
MEFEMKRIDYMTVAPKAMEQIKQGAFLTVKSGEALNTMTIGWATIGHVWRKPIMMVAVRLSRHTLSASLKQLKILPFRFPHQI